MKLVILHLLMAFAMLFCKFKSKSTLQNISFDSLLVQNRNDYLPISYFRYNDENVIVTDKGEVKFNDKSKFMQSGNIGFNGYLLKRIFKDNNGNKYYTYELPNHKYTVKDKNNMEVFSGLSGESIFNTNGEFVFYGEYSDNGWQFILKKIRQNTSFKKIECSMTSSVFLGDTLFILDSKNGYSIIKNTIDKNIHQRIILKDIEKAHVPYLLSINNNECIIVQISYKDFIISKYKMGQNVAFSTSKIYLNNDINKNYLEENFNTFSDGLYNMISYTKENNSINILLPLKNKTFKIYKIW